jgi:hypothetical protein
MVRARAGAADGARMGQRTEIAAQWNERRMTALMMIVPIA